MNVLNKSELERVLDRQRRLHSVKERQEETEETPFQKMLTERAKRLEQVYLNPLTWYVSVGGGAGGS